tara:strand:+ start:109 stop:348 length:240 start_codon:yes stop_codon:yes gene_type:complete
VEVSGFDTGIEESVNVNDVLEETPLSLGSGLGVDVVLDGLSSGSFLLDLDGFGRGDSNNSSDDDFLEHFYYWFNIIFII